MNNTLFTVFRWPSWKILQYTEPKLCGRWYHHVNLIMEVFCKSDRGDLCKMKYLEHNEHVRRVVPAHRLLEYRVSEGWGPLCEFLEVPVPEVPYPTGNAPQEFMEAHTRLWKIAVYLSARRIALFSLPLVLAGASAMLWSRWVLPLRQSP